MTGLAMLAGRAAIILLATWLTALVLRRATAATRHLVWTLGVVGVLALPLLTIALPEWAILPPIAGPFAVSTEGTPRADILNNQAQRPAVASHDTFRAQVNAANPIGTTRVVAIVWAVVACAFLAHIACGILSVRHLARRARPASGRWNALLAAALINARGRRVRLLVSDEIAMPMTWGGRPAVLLLPRDALAWSDERARAVLLHEIAHILRTDWLTHALARLVAALHWFNPLAWIALHAMTRERECACDDYVLLHGARATDYADHLLDIARAGHAGVSHAIAPAMARRSGLESRLLAILTPHRLQPGRRAARAMTVGAVLTTTVIAAAAPIAQPRIAIVSSPKPPGNRPRAAPATSLLDVSSARSAVKTLARDLQDPSAEVREDAALGLAMSEHRAAIEPLITALKDPDVQVREKAALGLGFRSEASVLEPLIAALRDPAAQVREKAAIGLGMRRSAQATDALLKAASDPDSQVREKVIMALGLSGDPRAAAAIMAATHDPDPQVREKAKSAVALEDATSPAIQEAIRAGVAAALRLAGGERSPRE